MEDNDVIVPQVSENVPELPEIEKSNEESLEIAPVVCEPTEKKVLPAIDFSTLSTEEFVKCAQSLLNEFSIADLRELFEHLPELFESQYKEEYEKAVADFIASGGVKEEFVYAGTEKESFYEVYRVYREKKSAIGKKIEHEREHNLKVKLKIIEELKELIKKEETLNKTFADFRSLQELWRSTGMVPQQNLNDVLENYHLQVENFYGYIKINKELRDMDLKRNLDAKNELCEEAEKLIENQDINKAFKDLQLLHYRWKEIGPVPLEQKESLWERFKAISGQINDNYHNFFDSLRREQEENLVLKNNICDQMEELANREFATLSELNQTTQRVLDLQEEWKHSGTIPQKDRNRLYKKFKVACDSFFEKRREFHKNIAVEQNANLAEKIALCEKVEALKDSLDWKTTTDKIIAIQKDWKKTGPAPKKYANKVWLRFRLACDTFFNNKSAHLKDLNSGQEKNLELKQQILEELKQFVVVENLQENIEKLKEIQVRWSEIGFVPIKEKDRIQEEFRTILNGYFDKLNLDEADRNIERFRVKMDSIDDGDRKDYKIVQEREKLMAKIRQLESEVNTLDNNMGFISKNRKSEGLIRMLTENSKKTKERLAVLNEKLKIIDAMI